MLPEQPAVMGSGGIDRPYLPRMRCRSGGDPLPPVNVLGHDRHVE
jgi:hypothetical protein